MPTDLPYVSPDVPRGGAVRGFFTGGAKGGFVGALGAGSYFALGAAAVVLLPAAFLGLAIPGITALGAMAAVLPVAGVVGAISGGFGALSGGTIGTAAGSVVGLFSGHADSIRAERVQKTNDEVTSNILLAQRRQREQQRDALATLALPATGAPTTMHADRLLAGGYQPAAAASHADTVLQRQQAQASQSQIQ